MKYCTELVVGLLERPDACINPKNENDTYVSPAGIGVKCSILCCRSPLKRRERERDRERDRRRDRLDRDSRRHNDSQGGNSRSHSRKGSPSSKDADSKRSDRGAKDGEKSTKGDDASSLEAAKAIQERIEEDMKKRRERMEAWRQKMQKEEGEQAKEKPEDGEEGEGGEGEGEGEKKKGWTLEDDDEDDEQTTVPADDEEGKVEGSVVPGGPGKSEEPAAAAVKEVIAEVEMDEDVDPLDAFMVGVQEEVKQIQTATRKKLGRSQFGKRTSTQYGLSDCNGCNGWQLDTVIAHMW